MTDAEVICRWMARQLPMPTDRDWSDPYWHTALDLDALHEVEARLTDEQWWQYEAELSHIAKHIGSTALGFIHATTNQKIRLFGFECA
jgi:hypothetical protein